MLIVFEPLWVFNCSLSVSYSWTAHKQLQWNAYCMASLLLCILLLNVCYCDALGFGCSCLTITCETKYALSKSIHKSVVVISHVLTKLTQAAIFMFRGFKLNWATVHRYQDYGLAIKYSTWFYRRQNDAIHFLLRKTMMPHECDHTAEVRNRV